MSAFTSLAEALAAEGGITRIGVAEEAGETALSYAGMNTIQKYFGGVKKVELLFTLSGADTSDRQQELIDGLIGILEALKGYKPEVEGIQDPVTSMAYPPKAVMYNGNYWIYNAGLRVACYIK
jgi:hypothetical protein